MVDLLSIPSIILELGIAAFVGKQTLIIARQTQLIAKQKDILADIESKLDKEFEQIEVRVNSLLSRFDEDIRATTTINYEMHQVLQDSKADIGDLLSRNNEVLHDLKGVGINLLVESKVRLLEKNLGLDDDKDSVAARRSF